MQDIDNKDNTPKTDAPGTLVDIHVDATQEQAPIIVDLRTVIADLRQQAGHDVDLGDWTAVANYLEATKGLPDTQSYPLREAIEDYMKDVYAGRGKEPEVLAKREALQESTWNQSERLYGGSPYAYGHGIPEFASADAETCFYGMDEEMDAIAEREAADKLALQVRVEQAEETARLATERAEAAEAELAKLKQ